MKRVPAGMILNHDSYLRIKRGPQRDQMAHRAYAARQLGLPILPAKFEVHHECGNRSCFPPTDFHLVVVSECLGPHMYKTHAARATQRRRRRHV